MIETTSLVLAREMFECGAVKAAAWIDMRRSVGRLLKVKGSLTIVPKLSRQRFQVFWVMT